MKKLILLSAFLLASFFCNAQAVQDWTAGSPILNNYNNHLLATDSQGNIYKVGTYNGTSYDFDPSAGVFNMSSISQNMYLVKLNAAGNFVWAKQIGGGSTLAITSGTSITIDASDNVYVSGSTNKIIPSANIDFDPGAGVTIVSNPSGHYVMYILKLDSNGNLLWNAQFNNPTNTQYDQDKIYAMTVDATGNVYATGAFNSTVDFDPSTGVYNLTAVTDATSTDIFILKLNNTGNLAWAKALLSNTTNGTGGSKGCGIGVDSSGNVYTTGYYWFAIDADPGAGTHNIVAYTSSNPVISGGNTQYISKLDSAGNYVWAYDLVGNHNDQFLPSLAVDSANNIVVSGDTFGNVGLGGSLRDFDFGTGTFSLPADSSSFILKINSNAGFIWAKCTSRNLTGSNSDNFSPGMALDSTGSIFLTGGFGYNGAVDFDPSSNTFSLTSAGNFDGFISKLDNNGNFVWANKIGGTGIEFCYSIVISPLGKVTVSGSTNAGFAKSVTAVTTGGFIASYTQPALATSQFELDKNIIIYPNPTSGEFNIKINEDLIGSKVSIYNIVGQKIKDFSLDVLTITQNLNSGMYLLEIVKDGSKTTRKLIVN